MRKILASLATVVAGLALAVAPAASASALPSPICNNVVVTYSTGYPVPVPAYDGNQTCYMQRWDGRTNTSSLSALQVAINICYIQKGRINKAPLSTASPNTYGPLTQAAVVAVQQWHGIEDDGGWGPQTRRAMQWPDNNALTCRNVSLPG